MKKNKIISLALAGLISVSVFAGNDKKRGSAGAPELLMNPWSRSSGWAGANTSGIGGVEAMRFNIAGIADVKNMDVKFVNTTWMKGSDVTSNAFGFVKSVGDNSGAFGVSIMSLNYGEFIETTVDQPEGTGITFKPNFFNLGIGYSKIFSRTIKGGVLVRVINQSVQNVSTTGVAIDAGIQYHMENFKFGVSLRNVGPPMRYSGDGLGSKGKMNGTNIAEDQTLNQRAEKFELPSLMNIGASYTFNIDTASIHELVAAGNFVSNSFTNDRFQFGLEYGFKKMVYVRAGFDYYNNMFSKDESLRTDITGGPTFGITLQRAFGSENNNSIGIDYSYRNTSAFDGHHSIGLVLSF